jgi:type VI secretion system protein ImpJ
MATAMERRTLAVQWAEPIMRRHHRVLWSKGMFLTPQHFQAQDVFVEDELRFRGARHRFANWGVSELEIDADSIPNRVFRVIRCAGFMSDGTVFDFPDGNQNLAGRSFDKLLPPGSRALNVYLAVPERQTGGQNISHNDSSGFRYAASDMIFVDEYDGQEEPIQVARPNFRILFEGESTTGLDSIQLARIQLGSEGGWELNQNFIPPCLNAACNTYLWDRLLKRLLERLIFVSERLKTDRSQASELLADFQGSDIRRFWVLHIVNRALPELMHIHSIGNCHPEDLYRFLLRLGGALCTFSEMDDPSSFPVYNHQNLGECLPAVTEQVERMLRTIAYRRKRCQNVPLQSIEAGRHWKAKLGKEAFDRGKLYLGLRKDPATPVSEIESNLKVLGRTTAEDAVTLAGLQISQELQAPADCARREGYVYFRIIQPSYDRDIRSNRPSISTGRGVNPEGTERSRGTRRLEVWRDVEDNEEIHLVDPKGLSISNLELLVVLPDAQGSAPLS